MILKAEETSVCVCMCVMAWGGREGEGICEFYTILDGPSKGTDLTLGKKEGTATAHYSHT